jgi:hypothetical protein
LPNDKKTLKVPTEKITFDDVWNGFKSDYLPFVDWVQSQDDDFQFLILEFVENAPTPYTNKWSRAQFKMKVSQNDEIKMLSAGKKLFIKIKAFCISENKLPCDLGKVQIDRFGSGFDTDYKVQYSQK